MNSKIFFSVFIWTLNFSDIIAQLSCNYSFTGLGYTCELVINNPNGLNNFGSIGGTHLPGYTEMSVEMIKVAPGSISTNFPSVICLKFKNIKQMTLWTLGITRIDDYSFIGCTKLTKLQLLDNPIISVHEKAFNKNLDLLYIDLFKTNLTTLPEYVFQYQQQLEFLMIGFSNIEDLPANIFKPFKNLKILDLSDNKLKLLRLEWFVNLTNVVELFIKSNHIAEFPKNVFTQLKSMHTLIAYDNRLKMIHADSFGFLPNLTSILVDVNKIEAIDENLIDYTGITTFIMFGNLCANDNIDDYSEDRYLMRAMLRECFNNYERLTSGEWMVVHRKY